DRRAAGCAALRRPSATAHRRPAAVDPEPARDAGACLPTVQPDARGALAGAAPALQHRRRARPAAHAGARRAGPPCTRPERRAELPGRADARLCPQQPAAPATHRATGRSPGRLGFAGQRAGAERFGLAVRRRATDRRAATLPDVAATEESTTAAG